MVLKGGLTMKSYTFEDYMLPILRIMSDREIRDNQAIREELIRRLKLSGSVLEVRSKNGHLKYADNINFALSYLQMAGLLVKPGRGRFQISETGINVERRVLNEINTEYLKSLNADFKARIEGGNSSDNSDFNPTEPKLETLNPNELIERGEGIIKDAVKTEILSLIMASTPAFFEKLVVDLVMAMGYGFDEKSGLVLGKSHDGGIDGTILEDKLGLSKIHLQAKRYQIDKTVGSPDVQKFAGALPHGSKGIFITTSKFSKEAVDYVSRREAVSIALIDGEKLLDLMFEHNVGVSKERIIEIKSINSDYFTELG